MDLMEKEAKEGLSQTEAGILKVLDGKLRRINNAQNLFNRRVEGAQNGFNALGDAIGGIFDSSPAPKTKSSSGSGGLGLLVAGAAIAGGAYLFKKFFGSNDKDKNKTQQQTLAQK